MNRLAIFLKNPEGMPLARNQHFNFSALLKDTNLKRRSFLKTGTFVSLPLILNGMGLSAKAHSSLFPTLNTDHDKVLVIIQLNGGNDGLNMIVPVDQYDNLAKVRSNLLLPEKKLLPITSTIAFHPAMTGLRDLYHDGRLGIVQNVGYPNQNRSHFRSMDIWTSGSPSNQTWHTGWLGRFFENRFPNYPNAYPNDKYPDPFAITMGNTVSMTCQGSATNYSVVIDDPYALAQTKEDANQVSEASLYAQELAFLQERVGLANAYGKNIRAAAACGSNMAAYPAKNYLADQLKNVALLISGGLKTKIYIVAQSGYDTHGNQAVEGDTTKGVHAGLLKELSEAIFAFQQDLKALGLQERVVGMTFSEFGRRIRSNDSLGTDHGTAAPLLIFGSCIVPQILGNNPKIDKGVGKGEGVLMQYDFRDVYGSVLMSLFDVDATEARQILYPDFKYLPLI